jgi:Rrf2 family protein
MAVHVLTVLAYHKDQRVTSSWLASSVNTNPVVVRRLLLALQAAGLVKTRRGAGFGSCLAHPPGHIPLARVFRAVETDEPFVMPRSKPNPECPVGHCIESELQEIFRSARTALERELGKTTLADVLGKVHECCDEARLGSRAVFNRSRNLNLNSNGASAS